MKRKRASNDGHRSIQRLAIHERRVLTGTGDARTERTVECPSQARAVDVATCLGCSDGRGLGKDRGRAFVRCSPKTWREGRPLEALESTHLGDLGLLTPIADIMTSCVVCVRNDVDVDAILALMDEHRINAVPVVDERGRPIGIVSKIDLLRELQQRPHGADQSVRLRDDGILYDPGPGFHVDSLGRLTAEDVMTKMVVWLPPEAPIASAAGIMAADRIHHAVVLSEDRHVIGIVSSIDLLAWMAQEAGLDVESKSNHVDDS